VIVAALAPLRGDRIANRIDAFIEDLAYLIFLVHLTVRFALEVCFNLERCDLDSWAFAAVLLTAIVISRLAAAVIELLRDFIRSGTSSLVLAREFRVHQDRR